jgi:hypothetical protein
MRTPVVPVVLATVEDDIVSVVVAAWAGLRDPDGATGRARQQVQSGDLHPCFHV